MKKAVAGMMLLAGGLFAAPRVTVGIGFGAPAPVIAAPLCPGPGYTWVDAIMRRLEFGWRDIGRRQR